MVDHPVGSGKGELIVACPLAFPCRWGLFLQDAALVEQLAERFGKRAPPGTPPVGIVWRDTWRVGERLTIISIQTLDQQWRPDLGSWSPQAKQLLESLEGIEVDECHGSSSATAIRQLRSTPRAWYRVGFSATVRGRSDKRDHVTQGHFGPVICRVEPAELEAQGRISSGQVIMVRVQQDQIPPFQEGGYQAGIVRSRARNQQVLELIRQAPKPTLWFVEEIEHGEILLGLCRQAGLRAVFVQGETPDPLKRQLQRELDLGAVEVGIATNTWKQGIDIVHLRSGGTAAGKKSIILAEQRRGRTVRACQVRTCQVCARDGQKRTFVWYDLYDQAPHRPGQKPHWLELQSRARYRTYQDKGQQVVMR